LCFGLFIHGCLASEHPAGMCQPHLLPATQLAPPVCSYSWSVITQSGRTYLGAKMGMLTDETYEMLGELFPWTNFIILYSCEIKLPAHVP